MPAKKILQWSRNYAACVRCGTTSAKHQGFGVCARCRSRMNRLTDPEKTAQYNKKHFAKYYSDPANRAKRKAYCQAYYVKHHAKSFKITVEEMKEIAIKLLSVAYKGLEFHYCNDLFREGYQRAQTDLIRAVEKRITKQEKK